MGRADDITRRHLPATDGITTTTMCYPANVEVRHWQLWLVQVQPRSIRELENNITQQSTRWASFGTGIPYLRMIFMTSQNTYSDKSL